VAVLVAAIALTAAPAHADDRGETNNLVHIENRNDGAFRAKGRAAVTEASGPSVNNNNLAYSYASCTDCRTVTAAIQVVVVEGPVNDYQPANAAVAINENCLRCQTYAFARQVVLTPYRPVSISDRADEQIEGIQAELSRLVRSGESFPQLDTDLGALTDQLVAVVQAEIDRSNAISERGSDQCDTHIATA
jgi:hypothetical protein